MKSNTVYIEVVGGEAYITKCPKHVTVCIRNYDGNNEKRITSKMKKTPSKERFLSCCNQLIEEGQLVIAEFQRAMLKVFPMYWDGEFRQRTTKDIEIKGTQCYWIVTGNGLELIHSDGEQIKLDCLEMDEIVDFADSLILDWDEILKELKKYGTKIKARTDNPTGKAK